MIRPILTALTLAAAVCATPALAQDVVSIKVSYSDLNLNSTAGAAILQRRIDAAVAQICGTVDTFDLRRSALVAQCRREVSAAPYDQSRQAVAKARQTVLASAPQSATVAR
jgi:UrcA family protein